MRHDRIVFLILSVAFVAVLAGAAGCVNASAPNTSPAFPPSGDNITSTPAPSNATLTVPVPRPATICHCPMIPAGVPATPVTPYPDDGLCHCP
ncbi:hypothetical protein [Methanoregula sp.]|uniref:hypothetical protein n=1 Tax=Methanoregula sp. TaxID=2052170 RepID=UPI002B6EB48F|nr:hypothetical protein [Methanoregula sp.]HVP96813.1 hypothetical protein [Methanoregula sp.]